MQPRDIVRKALRFASPPRLPVRFPLLGATDFADVGAAPAAGFKPAVEDQDEWGCVWRKTQVPNMGQVKGHPLQSLGAIAGMAAPDYDDDSRYLHIPAELDRFEREGKYVTAGIFMVLFERMHTLFGFENVLAGLLEERRAMEDLADRIVAAHLKYVENISRRFGQRVHAIGMTDDWGTQKAAFISLDLWMDFFHPRYRRLFDFMHSCGYDVWLHSCGKVNELVEGFIRAGVDAVNLQQPRALGIPEMGKRYRGRITFESLADIQSTLPKGDPALVDQDAGLLAEHWMAPEGGFVFSDYGDPAALGIRDDAIKRHMYRRFSEASQRIHGLPLPAIPT